jgi:ATP-dependent 26S proteasome regulatory subunit
MYLCTTNYIDRLSDRILRPGRIDRKINVPHPPRAGRIAFLESKLGSEADEVNSLAEATRGLSFAHLRELLVGIYCLNQDPEKVLKRLHNKGPEELSPKKEAKLDRKIHAAVRNGGKRRQATAAVKRLKPAPFKLTAEEKLFLLKRRNRV